MAIRRRTWWSLLPVVVIALAGVLWIRGEANDARGSASARRARSEDRPIPVRTVLVSSRQTTEVVGATAVTAPSRRVSLLLGSSQRFKELNPTVRAVHVHDGAFVDAGAPLVELQRDHFERALSEKTVAVAAAQAALARAEAARLENEKLRQVELDAAAAELEFRAADVDFRKDDHQRLKGLRDAGQANLTEYLEAAAAYAEARYTLSRARLRDQLARSERIVGPVRDREDVERARHAVALAERNLKLAEDDLARTTLRSPFDGFVDGIDLVVGQTVLPTEVLVEVLGLDPIHVIVDFPQARIAGLTVGLAVEVVFDTFGQEKFTGLIVRIPVRVDAKRRVLPIVVEVANPSNRIKAGVSAYVRIDVPTETIVAPSLGVTRLDTHASVVVVERGRARLAPMGSA